MQLLLLRSDLNQSVGKPLFYRSKHQGKEHSTSGCRPRLKNVYRCFIKLSIYYPTPDSKPCFALHANWNIFVVQICTLLVLSTRKLYNNSSSWRSLTCNLLRVLRPVLPTIEGFYKDAFSEKFRIYKGILNILSQCNELKYHQWIKVDSI